MKIPMPYRFVAILLACLIFFITIDVPAQQNPPPPDDPQEWVLVACVLVAAGIVIGIGGCAGKKLLDKPPRTFPDEDEPPHPPACTNSPAGPITNSPPKKRLSASIPIAAGAENPATCAMIKWDITRSSFWQNDTNSYHNTVTGRRFTHIITATIQGSTDGKHWNVVGSRIIWWSEQDITALINYYDPNGQLVLTRYVPRQEMTIAPYDSDSKVPLEEWEIGDEPQRFYRLASPTNRIGVLTNAQAGTRK